MISKGEVSLILKESLDKMPIGGMIFINEKNTIHDLEYKDNDTALSITYIFENTYNIAIGNCSTSGGSSVHDFPRLSNFQFFFINELMNYKKNNIHYCFNFSEECPTLKNYIFDFYTLQINNNIKKDRILISGSDFYGKKFIKNYSQKYNITNFTYIPRWNLVNHTGLHLLDVSDKMFRNTSLKKYKSTSLFARIDDNRIRFVYYLYGIDYFTNNNLFSCFSNFKEVGFSSEIYEHFYNRLQTSILDIERLDDFEVSECAKRAKVGRNEYQETPLTYSSMLNVPENNDSYLWISSESEPTKHEVMFITEKILKSYLWYKPLIVYAVPNTINLLKKIGFIDVFELMGFSSDYDLEYDDEKRLQMIINEIDKFNKLSIEEIHKLYYSEEIQVALEKNNKLFRNLIGDKKFISKNSNNDFYTIKNDHIFEENLKKVVNDDVYNIELDELGFDTSFLEFFQ